MSHVRSIYMFMSLMIMLPLTPVKAENCLKYPKRCLKDVDRRRRQATGVIIDIATLGSTKREREREEANRAKELAAQRNRHAHEMKLKEIETRKYEIAIMKERKALIEKTILNFSMISKGIEGGIKLTQILLEDVKVDRVRAAHIQELIVSQNSDLLIQLNGEKTDDPQVKAHVEDLKVKIEAYKLQLEMFPLDTVSEDDLNNLSTDLIEQSFAILALAQNNTASMKNYLIDTESRIQEIETSLTGLQK